MKNEEPKVWVTVSETINIGNYESIKIDAGYSKTYSAKENPEELIKEGINEIQKIVQTKAKALRKKRSK